MAVGTGVSPVAAEVRLVGPGEAGEGRALATASVRIDASEPVFAGHYPDFPIFPGVCVVECVLRGARLAAPQACGDLYLAAVESARYLRAVFAGDVLDIGLEFTWDRTAVRCRAKVGTQRGEAAVVRLRYRRGESS
ncbi:hypothetical protein BS329_20490 [Amycolatopsis coloradensis]|uniref:ApeI dehydratase-like domain-containing protein n=1 Tax=Amycolatopsis coloradensis TaxID=76021 RepID=A0A1R0KQP9_9PSEU|nr:hypothetical protein [Amycolatopsis coloradensis]OLZ50012.1 hypothetical protein BS329_20490 [Amycolatopsis coloradensis]